MKKYIVSIIVTGLFTVGLSSCGEDFLTVRPTDKLEAGAPSTIQSIQQNLAATYQILTMDSYADSEYNSILLLSDLRSDDLFKAGNEANDRAGLYFLSLYSNTPSDVPAGIWTLYFTGLARANDAIQACENVTDGTEEQVNRLSAEGHALRAYFVSQLWLLYGNIPWFDGELSSPFMAKQLKADEVYQKIITDLDYAIAGNKLPGAVSGPDMGRVSKAMAQMLKARVVMYQNDQARYNEVLADMVEIINNPAYGLMDTLEEIFLPSGEFCKETIFETNQRPEGKTWGDAWKGYGTNLPVFISPNSLVDPDGVFISGWGFGTVRQEAYDMYAPDDTRRDASINDWRGAEYAIRFQDTGLFMRKYAARKECNVVVSGDNDLNFDNNLRIFRLPEAYLNAAELVLGGASAPGAQSAQYYLDVVRERAFGDKFQANKMNATLENIKQERRLEFLGEGLRYWDLVRWGDAPRVLTENNPEFFLTRTWDPAKNKYLPIPQSEIDKTKGYGEYELVQNPY